MSASIHNVALTAVSAAPVCGDNYAARFIDDTVRARMAPLIRFAGPAASNVARHRLIDDLLRDALNRDPGGVLVLGAG
jgi:O-methyltransferase involved in polyketide biosynthesis